MQLEYPLPMSYESKKFNVLSFIYSAITVLSVVQYAIVLALSTVIVQVMKEVKLPPEWIFIGRICILIVTWGFISQIAAIIISCAYGHFSTAGKIYYVVLYISQLILHYVAYEPMEEIYEKISEGDLRKPLLAAVLIIIFVNGILVACSAVIFLVYLFIPPKTQYVYRPIYYRSSDYY